MASTAYSRPPITEAVIELRFNNLVERAVIEKAAHKLRSRYFHRDEEAEKTFEFDLVSNSAKSNTQWNGLKLSSMDFVDITIVRPGLVLFSRLAPYVSWEQLFERARADWSEIYAAIGYNTIGRIGLRYVNRVDIPGALKQEIDPARYLTIKPDTPKLDWETTVNYFLQVERKLDGFGVLINSGPIQSPLVGYRSIALDIDVASTEAVNSNSETLWDVLSEMRAVKNRIFEACITDEARELFGP